MRQFLIVLLSCLTITTVAQTEREPLKVRVNNFLKAKYNKISYDTNYVTRPKSLLTVKVRTNISGNAIHARGVVKDVYTKADLKTDYKATLSLGVNYQGVTAGFAINPSSLTGRNHDFEMNLNIYSSRYSIDASYQSSKTLSGTMVRDGVKYDVERGYIDMKVFNLAGYYTFNYRRFSYPAAFTQTYIQKRSAGSWLAGFSYLGGRLQTTDETPDRVPKARIYIGHFGIGGGYGYNLVIKEKWLFHLSALPTLVLINRNNLTVNGERRDMRTYFPDVIFNERVAIVRNFSDRYFAGATLVMSNSLFKDNEVRINQNKWRARFCFGVRF